MKLRSLLFAPLLVVACATEDSVDDMPKGDDPFEISDTGKADGSGLLSSADQQRIEQAFDAAVAAGEATITKLETEIANLEQQQVQKQQEANALVSRIASREQELRDQYNRNIALCLFFPNPAVCVLANYIANDSTLKSYKSQLAAAQAAQQTIANNIASYRAKRDVLRAKLVPVREGKTKMIALLRDGTTVPIPAELQPSPMTANAYSRAQVMLKIEDSIGTEIDLLVEIRNAAVEVANTIDQSLATLRSLEQSVDKLVEKQRKQFMDLLFNFLSGDPAAAADKWLEDVLAAKTRELLNTLEWPLNEFARYLVESRGGGGDIDGLIQRILQKLGQMQQPLVFDATTPVNILDLTTAKSTLTVTGTRPVTGLEVFVSIHHTYVGDLIISLEKDGKSWPLQKQVGGSADDIVKTFRITDPQGVSLAGKWSLVVSDVAKQDSGKLDRWQLIVR